MRKYVYPLRLVFSVNKAEILKTIINQAIISTLLFISVYADRFLLDTIQRKLANNVSKNLSIDLVIIISIPILVMVFTIILNIFNNILISKQQLKFGMFIDNMMLKKIVSLDLSCFDNPNFYNICASANSSKARLNFLVYRVNFFIGNIITVLYSIVVCIFEKSGIYMMAIIVSCIPLLIVRAIFAVKEFNYENDNQEIIRKFSYMSEILLNKETAKEIRFYNIKEFIIEKFFFFWKPYFNDYKKIQVKSAAADSITTILPYIIVMFVQINITKKIVNGQGGIGDFVFYFTLFITFITRLCSLIDDLAKLKECEAAVDYLNQFEDIKPQNIAQGTLKLQQLNSIEFINVNFTYPLSNTKAINNLNLKIDMAKSNAIVGINGSGKTTLVKILLRLYDVDDGMVLLNGHNIADYSIKSIRDQVSVVFQDYLIYSFSLRFNIALSDYKRMEYDNDIIDLVEKYYFYTVNELRGKLDTQIGRDFDPEGVELSGGNKQRLAILRALFKENANVLVMDEPNASLDVKIEQTIFDDIISNSSSQILLISHRLESIRKFNNIIVLENGCLIENGGHEELMDKKGQYYKMFHAQYQKYFSADKK